MGRFEQIALQIANLPMDRQDVIADFIADQFSGDLNPQYQLSDAQLEMVRLRMTKPFGGNVASDEEVALAFGQLGNKYG